MGEGRHSSCVRGAEQHLANQLSSKGFLLAQKSHLTFVEIPLLDLPGREALVQWCQRQGRDEEQDLEGPVGDH